MITATAFLTYLWHYVVARAIYDQLLRPVIHGRGSSMLAFALLAVVAFLLGRISRGRA